MSWVAVAAAAVSTGATIYSVNSANKSQQRAEEQAALDRAGLMESNATNEAFLEEMLAPIDIGGLQSQAIGSNLRNFNSIADLGSQFSEFNVNDTLRAAEAAGINIPAFTNILARSALGDITGSYYNTGMGRNQIQNILSAGAPSFSVAANSLYSQPFANGTGVGENRFIGNYLRDAEQRRQGGLQNLAGLVDSGISFSARLNSQTAALMQSQFLTPDVAISAESQRRSLGTQTGLAALSANSGLLGGISSNLNNARLAAGQTYAQAGQQLGNTATQLAMSYNSRNTNSSNLS